MKILVLDIEISANLAHVWGIWQQNVGLDMLMEQSKILCFAAKWVGHPEVVFSSVQHNTEELMLTHLHDLLHQADVVVTYNGDKFDIPIINREFIANGITPPAPYKSVDVLKTVRNRFRFPSNKLSYVCKQLGVGMKAESGGYKTWVGCMENDEASWKKMESYNRKDIKILERLYKKVLPWIKAHPNHGLYDGKTKCSCPNCGSTNLQKRGLAHSKSFIYQRYFCNKCGSWSRAPRPMKDARKDLAVVLTKEN